MILRPYWGIFGRNYGRLYGHFYREAKRAMASIQSPQELGEALRAVREPLRLTQQDLALAAGVGVRFLVDLEAGKATVRLEQVLRVIDALGGEVAVMGLPSDAAGAQDEGRRHGE